MSDIATSHTYREFEDFRGAYVEAMLWVNTIAGDDECFSHDSRGYELDDLASNQADEDCEAFLDTPTTELVRDAIKVRPGFYDFAQAGHDFALTRNGHGAGFWDRGLGDVGDQLTALAKPYGECTWMADTDKEEVTTS